MSSHIQSILFSRSKWTIEQAIQWLHDHEYVSKKVDVTDKYLRFRQREPDYKRYHYRIKRIGNGISFELAFPGSE
jgi:hypothetical protein